MTPRRKVWLVTLLFTGVCAVIALRAPRMSFWSPDCAMKFLQVEALRFDGHPRVDVPYAGRKYDPTLVALPIGSTYFDIVKGDVYTVWPILFPLLVKPFFLLLGWFGLFVVPIGAGAACVALSGFAAEKIRAGTGWIAALILGASSPVVVYSVLFWEHTSALALALAATLLIVSYAIQGKRWQLVAGAAAGGFSASGVRFEVVLFVAALIAGACLAAPRRDRLRVLALSVTGGIAGSAPAWAVNLWTQNRLLQGNISRNVALPQRLNFSYLFDSNIGLIPHFLAGTVVPNVSAWATTLAAAALIEGFYAYRRKARRVVGDVILLSLLVLGIASLFDLAQILDGHTAPWFHGWFAMCPVLVLGMLDPPETLPESQLRALRTVQFAALAYALILIPMIGLTYPNGVATDMNQEWGPRYWLPVFPIMAVLAGVNWDSLTKLFAAGEAAGPKSAAALGAFLFATGLAFNVMGIARIRVTEAAQVAQRLVLQEDARPLLTDFYITSSLFDPEDFFSRPSFYLHADPHQLTGDEPTEYSKWLTDAWDRGMTSFQIASFTRLPAHPFFRAHPPSDYVVVVESTEAVQYMPYTGLFKPEGPFVEDSVSHILYLTKLHLVHAETEPAPYRAGTAPGEPPAKGSRTLFGSIRARYVAMGAEKSYLGLPLDEEQPTNHFCANGRVVKFEHGQIDACPRVGAWAHLDPDTRYPGVDFDSSSYTQEPGTSGSPAQPGTYPLYGLIRERYVELGEGDGYLGFPLSSEMPTTQFCAQGRYVQFEHGRIDWCPRVGTWSHRD